MFTDKGFSHALAHIVLEKDPTNEAALKMLQQPKNRAIVNGVTYDLDKVSEESVVEIWAEDFVSRLIPITSGTSAEAQQEQSMVRIHYKSGGDHAGSFMSPPMTREAAIIKEAEMRQDPDLYDIEIRED